MAQGGDALIEKGEITADAEECEGQDGQVGRMEVPVGQAQDVADDQKQQKQKGVGWQCLDGDVIEGSHGSLPLLGIASEHPP